MFETLAVSDLTVGAVLAESIYDAQSKLLLRKGAEITESMIDLLKRRGRTFVKIEAQPRERIKSEQSDQTDTCPTCGKRVGLKRPTESDLPVSTWVCKGCQGIYFGTDRSAHSDLIPVDVMLTPEKEVRLAPEVDFAFEQSMPAGDDHNERRRHKRYLARLPATVVPLDEHFRIDGVPVQLTTHDISLGGVCLKHMAPLEHEYLYVDFKLSQRRRVRMLAEVVRQIERGKAYEIGCKYISRVLRHAADRMCSVVGCNEVAACEVIQVNVHVPEGKIFYYHDETCPYLCCDHVVENEFAAKGRREPRNTVRYPYSNQNTQQGFSIYTPLPSQAEK